ncbi:MAG: hypothetical protein ACTIJ9_04690 [Aequorivita sp.]
MIPWTKLIPTAVALVEMTGGLLSSNKKQKAKLADTDHLDSTSLLKRIEVLENNELNQAEVIQQMAKQNLALIKKAEKNYKLAITGVSISIISLILFFVLFFLKY